MDLKVKDLAELLDVHESTIRRWLTEGKIPYYKINQQEYRFNRFEVEQTLLNRKLEKHTEPEEKSKQHSGSKQFSLYRAIHKGDILYNVPGDNKEAVIRNAVKKIAETLQLDADVLSDLLLDRENLHPTALNNGLGVPHTRDFLLGSHQDAVFVAYPEKPIPYGALDGKPVHTLFFLFACDDKRHLHLLAKLAHLGQEGKSYDLICSKPKKDTLLDYIKDWEVNFN